MIKANNNRNGAWRQLTIMVMETATTNRHGDSYPWFNRQSNRVNVEGKTFTHYQYVTN